MEQGYDPQERGNYLRQGLKEAGWSDQEIERRIEIHQQQIDSAPVTSPGINPHSEYLFNLLCNDIEAAMTRLGLDSHQKSARGVEPRLGPSAALTNVIMTDEGIVTVGTHLFRFCGLVARAFARTLRLNPWLWEPDSYSDEAGMSLLRKNPNILIYWIEIYLSYAVTGTHIGVPFKPASKDEALLFEQIARSMEIFSIAHEYGHHHLQHGKDIEADAFREEFQADQFALKVCYEVEKRPLIASNPYLPSGAGGVIILLALETLRDVQGLLERKSKSFPATHPEVAERIAKFDSVAVLKPREFDALKGFRVASERLLRLTNLAVLETLKGMPEILAEHSKLKAKLDIEMGNKRAKRRIKKGARSALID